MYVFYTFTASDQKGQLPEKVVFTFLCLLQSLIFLPEMHARKVNEISGILVNLEYFSLSGNSTKVELVGPLLC